MYTKIQNEQLGWPDVLADLVVKLANEKEYLQKELGRRVAEAPPPVYLSLASPGAAAFAALKMIREAGENFTDWATWAQKMAAWGMEPDKWPMPGKDAPASPAPLQVGDLAAALHYPGCWDTAAYPALADALEAVCADFKCSECAADDAAPMAAQAQPDLHAAQPVAPQWKDRRAASQPAVEAQPVASDEALCPACKGSGEGMTMEGAGPDAYEVPCNCPHCGGTGDLLDAYNGVVALLDKAENKYLDACGKLFAASLAATQPAVAQADDHIKSFLERVSSMNPRDGEIINAQTEEIGELRAALKTTRATIRVMTEAKESMVAALAARKPAAPSGEGYRAEFERLAENLGIYTCHFLRWTDEKAEHRAKIGEPVVVGDYVSGELQACWKIYQATAAAPAQAGVPDGWVHSIDKCIKKLEEYWGKGRGCVADLREVRDYLAAAPAQPSPQPADGKDGGNG
jgi:hypothetical protein